MSLKVPEGSCLFLFESFVLFWNILYWTEVFSGGRCKFCIWKAQALNLKFFFGSLQTDILKSLL